MSGYTLLQVQNALRGAKNWSSFKANIKKIKNNSTENGKIDQLFNYWYLANSILSSCEKDVEDHGNGRTELCHWKDVLVQTNMLMLYYLLFIIM